MAMDPNNAPSARAGEGLNTARARAAVATALPILLMADSSLAMASRETRLRWPAARPLTAKASVDAKVSTKAAARVVNRPFVMLSVCLEAYELG